MPTQPDADEIKAELGELAGKRGALVYGVADAAAFTAAQQGYRPNDILPNAKSVLVIGGARPRAGDWQSPNYQHMELTSTSDRIYSLGMKMAKEIEARYGYYAVTVPPGVDRGQRPFISIALAVELAGCGTQSLAGPILNAEHGFMYYSAIITTLQLPADGPAEEPACPAPACTEMWDEAGTTPCMATCPIDDGGCIGGRLEKGRIAGRSYDRARCTSRVYTHWVPGFQKVLESAIMEKDTQRRRMMLYSTLFTRSLWSITYSNISQGQCFECMRVCPLGERQLK